VSCQDVGRLLSPSDAIEVGGTFLEISEENIGPGLKERPPGGSNRPGAGMEARGRRGGIGFAVPRQGARKQAVGPVRKGMTEDISALIPVVRMGCHQRWAKHLEIMTP